MMPNFPFLKNKKAEDKSEVFVPSRRDFLKISSLATGGFLLGVNFQCAGPKGETITFAPNVFISINSDNEVTLIAHRSEMGTGIRTTLPQIVADELGADWSKIKIVQAVGDEEKYGNQNTDGSFSVRMFYEPMRKAGATARHMLIAAAAENWDLPASECMTENGQVIHKGSGKKVDFGDLVEKVKSATIPAPETVTLNDPSTFTLIGKNVPIYDNRAIATGQAVYGADVDLPNMLIAVVQRSPVVGAKIISWNEEKTLAVPGVKKVIKIEGARTSPGHDKPLEGLAILADNTWAAMKGADVLQIEWDLGPNQTYNSESQMQEMLASTAKDGKVRRTRGDFNKAKQSASKVVEKTYTVPYYAHSTIEPPTAIADVKADGSIEIWAPTQHPQFARAAVAQSLGTEVEKVKVNVTLLGGGFGRKSKPDFIVEAALLSKAANAPVRVQWTRQCDLHHDYYHSLSAQRIRASIDKDGQISGWNHHTVFPAIGATANPDEVHPSDGELGLGCTDFPYNVPNIRIESHESKAHTRIGWLRSVSNIHHSFAINCMMDELAELRGLDPVQQALDMLGEDRNITFTEEMPGGEYGNYGEPIDAFPWNTGRMKKVIERVANEAGWGKSLPEGQTMGFASQKSFLTYVACIVKVQKGADGNILIPEVHYAVDCGVAVNTDRVRSQFEGGAQFATSLAMTSAITFENGKVKQNNFDTYKVIRMPQSPKKIHVHIIDSQEKPTGVGEPPVPPYIPALCNAIYKLTGERIYQLPFKA
jgi:isoquinoline 1-oxidoreductase beta subunit